MKGINVLSLFDGISCGQVALERAGIKVNKYFASEIDEKAIKITMKNYPKTIQMGDVKKLNNHNFPASERMDLLIGGSPCQSFSNAGKRTGFKGKGELFWEFTELLHEVQPKYFLLENVKMKKEWSDIITKELGVEPIEIDSALVSAQQRRRLYWTNLPNISQPKDKKIYLKDILGIKLKESEDKICMTKSNFNVKVRKNYIDKKKLCKYIRSFKRNKTLKQIAFFCNIPLTKVERWFRLDDSFAIPDEHSWFKLKLCLDIKSEKWDKEITEFEIKKNNFDMAKRIYHIKGKHPTLTTLTGGHQRKTITDGKEMFYLNPEQVEELQTLPRGYTKGLSDNQRFKVIGNGWTVDVIAHLFKALRNQSPTSQTKSSNEDFPNGEHNTNLKEFQK